MGRSQLEKQKTHEKIVETASKRLREEGLEGIGVADLMKEAGLTVGGFYKHFASRDDLVAEAIQSAFDSWGRRLEAEGVDPAKMTAADIADRYVSAYHRDNPGEGCPFAALTADPSIPASIRSRAAKMANVLGVDTSPAALPSLSR